MVESKLTYNPYHLRSYHPAHDVRSAGDETQHRAMRMTGSPGSSIAGHSGFENWHAA